MGQHNTYRILHVGLRLEGPVKRQEIVDEERKQVSADQRNLIRGKQPHKIEYGNIDSCTQNAYDAEPDELLQFLFICSFTSIYCFHDYPLDCNSYYAIIEQK